MLFSWPASVQTPAQLHCQRWWWFTRSAHILQKYLWISQILEKGLIFNKPTPDRLHIRTMMHKIWLNRFQIFFSCMSYRATLVNWFCCSIWTIRYDWLVHTALKSLGSSTREEQYSTLWCSHSFWWDLCRNISPVDFCLCLKDLMRWWWEGKKKEPEKMLP